VDFYKRYPGAGALRRFLGSKYPVAGRTPTRSDSAVPGIGGGTVVAVYVREGSEAEARSRISKFQSCNMHVPLRFALVMLEGA